MDPDLVSSQRTAGEASGEHTPAVRDGNSSSSSSSGGGADAADAISGQTTDLVNSLSSWWGGFSKQATQTLEQARSNLEESSRGFVRAAKEELSRFEHSLEEAQAKARDQSKVDGAAPAGAAKGKGKARAEENADAGDDAEEQGGLQDADGDDTYISTVDANGDVVGGADPLKGPARKASTAAAHEPGGSGDAEAESGSASSGSTFDLDRTLEQHLQRASSLFSQLTTSIQTDPRVKNLQSSLTALGKQAGERVSQSVGGGDTSAASQSTAAEGADRSASDKGDTDMLGNLSSTIQSSLPHLSWQQSQALAQKYWHKSEEFAREIAQEVRGLAEDLVNVVPPEQQFPDEKKAQPRPKASAKETEKGSDLAVEPVGKAAGAAAKKEEEVPSTARSTEGLQTTTLPPTGGWGDSDDETPAPPKSAASTAARPADKQVVASGKKDDDDDDSDWE